MVLSTLKIGTPNTGWAAEDHLPFMDRNHVVVTTLRPGHLQQDPVYANDTLMCYLPFAAQDFTRAILMSRAVGRATRSEDVGVVPETVKKGGGELRLAGDMGPLSEGEVGGDDP